jgi:antitoxin StbD
MARQPRVDLAGTSVSITQLRRNPGAVIEAAGDEAVAVLVHNRPSAYLVPAAAYKRLLDRLEDLERVGLVRVRANERRVRVALEGL